MDNKETVVDTTEECCATCIHFNPLPGMEHTGVCWEWEKDRGY